MPEPEPTPSPAPARRPRRSWINRPVEERYGDAQNIPVAWAEHADLREDLGLGGVTVEHVEALERLLEPVTAAVKDRTTADRLAGEATKAAQKAMEAAEEAMVEISDRTTAAARIDPTLRPAFRVGRRATRRRARIEQLRRLLGAAEAHRAHLEANHGLKAAHLSDATEALDAAWTADGTADRRDAEAQNATHLRDAAMVPVDKAVRAIHARSGPLRRRHPQLLELIGLRPR
jgi:hypothetical protein